MAEDAGKSEGPSSGATQSVWTPTAAPALSTLDADTRADVCVIGAGIAGLTAAYLLAREGRSVVVLDDGRPGGGETGRTTAHLTAALDDRYYWLEKVHGEEGARLAAESHSRAVDRIEEIVRAEGIDCAFTRLDGYLFVAPGDSTEQLDRELEACHRAGLAEVRKVDRAPLPEFDTGPALVFPRQGQFHPLQYLEGLTRALQRMGGRVHHHTHAAEVDPREKVRVVTGEGPVVSADAVVIATNTPVNNRFALHTKQAAYRSYVVGLAIPHGAVPPALYWDTSEKRGDPDPYHYVRVVGDDMNPARDILIVGGEDHKTGQAEDFNERWERLEAWARERFPSSGAVLYRWSGQVMEPVDGLAFIGRNPGDDDRVHVITGDSGNGMTHGTLGGILVTDLIVGRENPWARVYEPGRISLRTTGTFLKENLNVAGRYAELVTGGDVQDAREIAPGSGAVLRKGLKKLAIYRDDAGELHEMSAVCPHLGCIVHWNSGESTWDCPCHGSRFDCLGKVVNGPANTDLKRLEA